MTETAFYVELPADEYGNTALPTAVIEARLAQDETAGRPKLTILAPAEIAQRWPTRYADFYNGYAETEGPARMLNRVEYGALIERIREKGYAMADQVHVEGQRCVAAPLRSRAQGVIAAVEVAIGGIRAIRARVLPQDFRCNAEREMFMQRQNVMNGAPYREPFPEVSFAQESDEYRAFPRRVPVRLFGSDVAAPSR